MGLLDDTPSRVDLGGREGEKLLRLYREVFDDEDRATFRRWVLEDGLGAAELYRRLLRIPEYDIGRSTVERGLPRLKALWES